MSNIKGTIQSVSCKEGNDHPKYGMSYQTSVKIDGEWYGAFTKKTADELGLEKGKLVSFTWTQNGKYKNFDPKSLAVAEKEEAQDEPAAKPAAKGTSSTTTRWAGEIGTTVGHAINNAVQLGIANKKTELKDIHGYAVDIITLARKLASQYDIITVRADKLIAKATAERKAAEAPAEEPEEQEEAPAPKPKATKPATKPAAAAKKPAPKKADPEPEEAEEAAQEPETAPEFDDDIPF